MNCPYFFCPVIIARLSRNCNMDCIRVCILYNLQSRLILPKQMG